MTWKCLSSVTGAAYMSKYLLFLSLFNTSDPGAVTGDTHTQQEHTVEKGSINKHRDSSISCYHPLNALVVSLWLNLRLLYVRNLRTFFLLPASVAFSHLPLKHIRSYEQQHTGWSSVPYYETQPTPALHKTKFSGFDHHLGLWGCTSSDECNPQETRFINERCHTLKCGTVHSCKSTGRNEQFSERQCPCTVCCKIQRI